MTGQVVSVQGYQVQEGTTEMRQDYWKARCSYYYAISTTHHHHAFSLPISFSPSVDDLKLLFASQRSHASRRPRLLSCLKSRIDAYTDLCSVGGINDA